MSIQNKSEILFLYETSNNIPNGDPFTGEQRYDEETKKIQVSDVRIKRFVRDYLAQFDEHDIYIQGKLDSASDDQDGDSADSGDNGKASGSARRVDELATKYKDKFGDKPKAADLLKQCIDVRLFGGISTKKQMTCNLTGPVQFALLNSSLNQVNLKMHQNTSVLESRQDNAQGAIATTTIVPYSLLQVHGWVNPKVAEIAGTTEKDLNCLFAGMWYGTSGDGSSFSRSKVGQNSILLLQIEYAKTNAKIYGVDRLLSITPNDNKRGEQIRSLDDYAINMDKLVALNNDNRVSKIRYYTEVDKISEQFKGLSKFEQMEL